MQAQNGLNQSMPFHSQAQSLQQQSQQPHYQHPHSNLQSGHNFNSQLGQQSIIHQQSQHLINSGLPNPLLPGNPGATLITQQQQQTVSNMQDPYYHHHRSENQTQQGQHVQPPHNLMQQSQQQQQQTSHLKLSELEFQEAFEKNRIVSSSAITRAVQDASIGKYKYYFNKHIFC
jgi:hypothetical protein